MTKTKKCIECKYSYTLGAYLNLETDMRCHHDASKFGEPNIITGKQAYKSAYEMRKYSVCGDAGLLWKKRNGLKKYTRLQKLL